MQPLQRLAPRWARFGFLLLAVAVLALPTAASAIQGASKPPEPPKPPKPEKYQVLVVTAGDKKSEFNKAAVKAITKIGQDKGTKTNPDNKFTVDVAQDAREIKDKFQANKIDKYRAIA